MIRDLGNVNSRQNLWICKKYCSEINIKIFFLLKMWMWTVINQDFSNCNHCILTDIILRILISPRISWFPKHNLNFLPVSLRNTWFHVIFPNAISLKKHKTVKWVNKWFETDSWSKKQLHFNISWKSTVGIFIGNSLIKIFWYSQIILVPPEKTVQFWFENFWYQFLTSKKPVQ